VQSEVLLKNMCAPTKNNTLMQASQVLLIISPIYVLNQSAGAVLYTFSVGGMKHVQWLKGAKPESLQIC
jgi:hypothetical protein